MESRRLRPRNTVDGSREPSPDRLICDTKCEMYKADASSSVFLFSSSSPSCRTRLIHLTLQDYGCAINAQHNYTFFPRGGKAFCVRYEIVVGEHREIAMRTELLRRSFK